MASSGKIWMPSANSLGTTESEIPIHQVNRSFQVTPNHGFFLFLIYVISDTSSWKSHHDLDPSTHIWGTTNDLTLFFFANVNLTNMEVSSGTSSQDKTSLTTIFERPAAGDSTPSTSIPVVDIFQPTLVMAHQCPPILLTIYKIQA